MIGKDKLGQKLEKLGNYWRRGEREGKERGKRGEREEKEGEREGEREGNKKFFLFAYPFPFCLSF